jgi:tetratricopeptide (TPR) repeat protein
MKRRFSGFFILAALLVSCHPSVDEIRKQIQQSDIKPSGIEMSNPVDGAVFPPEIQPPLFKWNDTSGNSVNWNLFIDDSSGNNLYQTELAKNSWRSDDKLWEQIKQVSKIHPVKITIIGEPKSIFKTNYPSVVITIKTSTDSVGAPIFFRAVPLPFSYAVKHVDQIKWYMAGISDKSPRLMLSNMPVCANCHSFNANGSLLAMDVDYANDKGSYAISQTSGECQLDFDHIITWSDYKRYDGEDTYGLLSKISPDGNNVLSTVKDRSVFVAIDNLEYSQLFFPVKGIIANYNRQTRQFSELEGANDRNFVQSNPTWSPDGRKVVFAKAPRYTSEKIDQAKTVLLSTDDAAEFISGKRDFKFNLYQLDYNFGQGGLAKPIEGAANNNKSNYFARYSPDGKWLVFCQASNFMLLQPDSKLYIIPANGGVPRLMNCNTDNMNSWHSWSPNSRWLVFSSKKTGAYTKIYLTHIDQNGNDSPPVLIENMAFDSLAINIPEFFPGNPASFQKITDRFSQTAGYYIRMAAQNIRSNDFKSAFQNIEKAITLDSNNYDAYLQRLRINELLNQPNQLKYKTDEARADRLISKAIAAQPDNPDVWLDKLSLLLLTKQFNEAEELATILLKKFPGNCSVYNLVSSLYRLDGNYAELIPLYNQMLTSCPENEKQTQLFLAIAYQRTGKMPETLKTINQLIGQYPDDYSLYLTRAGFYNANNQLNEALSDLNKAILINGESYQAYQNRLEFDLKTGNQAKAAEDQKAFLIYLNHKIDKQNNPLLLFERAEFYENSGDIKSALSDYDAILNQWPVNYKALKQKAKILMASQNPVDVLAIYQILIANYQPEAEFYNNIGLIQAQTGKANDALKNFAKALAIDPDNLDVLYNRAYFYFSKNNQSLAKADLTRLKQLLLKNKNPQLAGQCTQILTDVNKMMAQIENTHY